MGWLEKLKRTMGHRAGSGTAEQPKATEHDRADADCKKVLEQMKRNSIVLEIGKKGEYQLGGTRFGGQPDVPPNFLWPMFEGENFENEIKNRPLSFIAQFDCKELAAYDTEHLLPDHGLLSFFYEIASQRWGFDPQDQGCARAFWFEDISVLSRAEFPVELDDEFRLPSLQIQMRQEDSFPEWEDLPDVDYKAWDSAVKALGIEEVDNRSKLLGWADVIQGSMPIECELISKGYYVGNGWKNIPGEVIEQAKETALDRWLPLFQLDSIESGAFSLMFGDCGRIYFYIPQEDLQERQFDRVWLILQCY